MASPRHATPPGRALLAHDLALGTPCVAGADEAGRGALAGPIVAAAVLLRPAALTLDQKRRLERLNDSKRLRPAVREALALELHALADRIAVVAVSAPTIDEIGIQAANLTALSRALDLLEAPAGSALLVDGFRLPMQSRTHVPLVKGDATSAAIAAASIIAKTTRDRVMHGLDRQAPGYGFGQHAGYGTATHREAITRLGPCAAHRHSFAPIGLAA